MDEFSSYICIYTCVFGKDNFQSFLPNALTEYNKATPNRLSKIIYKVIIKFCKYFWLICTQDYLVKCPFF